jgi:glutathione S-transferase
MLELYSAPQSTCSQKVRLTLAEKNLDFIEHKMKLFQNDQLKPEYLKLNPNGVVPTLVDDGTPIIDSSVIMEYLDEVYPEIALSPAEPKQRAQMRAWLRFFEEVPTVAVRFPSYNAAFARHFEKMSDEEFKALAKSKPLRDKFLGEMDKQKGFSIEKLKQAEDSISKTVKRMENSLSQSEYLLGNNIWITDMTNFAEMNAVWDAWVSPGAMSLVHQLNLKDMPEICIFYCSRCQHAETVKKKRVAQETSQIIETADA